MRSTVDGRKGGKLKGPSHENNGIPAIVTNDNNRPIELEGEEAIVNKKSMQDSHRYTVTGTPRQIVSAMNALNGNGVVIEHGAKLTNNSTGQVQIMKEGGLIDAFDPIWYLRW